MRVEHNKLKVLMVAHIFYMLHRRSFKNTRGPAPRNRQMILESKSWNCLNNINMQMPTILWINNYKAN